MSEKTNEKPKLQNLAIPDPVHRRLKARAARLGKSIREVVVPALEDFLKDEPQDAEARG